MTDVITRPPTRISDLVHGRIQIPTPSPVLARVLRQLRDPQNDADKLAKVISTDSGLTARILRIANSAAYGLSREVKSIRQAVVVLGHKSIEGLVIAAASRSLYKRFGATERALWEHSLAAAVASQLVATVRRLHCREEAFVAGLMHDTGKIVMATEAAEIFEQAARKVAWEGLESIDAEQSVFGFNHTDVGSLLVERWQLAKSLEYATFLHHDLDLGSTIATDSLEIIALTRLADRFCHALALGTMRGPIDIDWSGEPAIGALGLVAADVQALLDEIKSRFDKGKSLLE